MILSNVPLTESSTMGKIPVDFQIEFDSHHLLVYKEQFWSSQIPYSMMHLKFAGWCTWNAEDHIVKGLLNPKPLDKM